jgi:hypothetical protein
MVQIPKYLQLPELFQVAFLFLEPRLTTYDSRFPAYAKKEASDGYRRPVLTSETTKRKR